jgi:hypothetical protein
MAIFGRAYPLRSAIKILAPHTGGLQTLGPGLVTDADVFYAPTVTPGAITLAPSLYSDSDTFYAPVVSSSDTLTPPFYSDGDAFYIPAVTAGPVTLSPSLYADSDTIYSVAVSAGDITLHPSPFNDADAFFVPTVVPGSITLSPPLYTDTDASYTPTVAVGGVLLAPAIHTDADSFYAETTVLFVQPGLVTDSDVLPLPSMVDIGTLLPGLVTSADVIYAPAIKGQILSPNIYTDTESFYAPSIHTTPVTVLPNRYVDTDVFYTPTVQASTVHGGNGGGGGGGKVTSDLKYATKFTMDASGLVVALQMTTTVAKTVNTRMMLYADNAGVPGALLAQSATKSSIIIGTQTYALLTPVSVLVGQNVWITVHTDGNISWLVTTSPNGSRYNTDLFSDGPSDPFGASSIDNKKAPLLLVLLSAVNANMSPPLMTDSDTFYMPAISTSNSMLLTRYVDTDFFYTPSTVNISPIQLIYLNEVEASDEFTITPVVTAGAVALQPPYITTDDAVIISIIGVGAAPTVFPPPIAADDAIYAATVTPKGADLLPGFVAADDNVPAATVDSPIVSTIDFIGSDDQIYAATVSRGSVTLAPARVTEIDQFWLEALVQGPGIENVNPDAVGVDDFFYPPRFGVPGHSHKATISGRADKVLSSIKGSVDGGVTIKGRADKVKATLEGNDA